MKKITPLQTGLIFAIGFVPGQLLARWFFDDRAQVFLVSLAIMIPLSALAYFVIGNLRR